MKRVLMFTLATLAALALAQRDAQDVLAAVIDSQRGGQTQRATITMTVVRPGEERTFEIDSVSDGLESSLIEVVAPSRDAGQAFLRDGDNLFLYNPRLRRVLRVPPSGQSDAFLGSDISYSDLSGRDLETDYTAEITNETTETVELTLTPNPTAPTPYGKVVLVADAATYAPREYTFFDQRGAAVKRITFSEFTQVDDLSIPTRTEVINLLREGESTVVVTSDYAFGVEIPETCFTERALERGC